jgi:hypothetical protein
MRTYQPLVSIPVPRRRPRCSRATGITLDHLPRDASLGRVRRFAKGAFLWQADDAADRIYFLLNNYGERV